jgi:hypothetical protein
MFREVTRTLLFLLQAREEIAAKRLLVDNTAKNNPTQYTVQKFIEKIMDQCQKVYLNHESIKPEAYIADSVFRGLVWEMVELKVRLYMRGLSSVPYSGARTLTVNFSLQGLALSKLDEWIENTVSSFIMYRFNAELRTVHRRRIAFQARCCLGLS